MTSPLHTIVYIGAGSANDLPELLAHQPKAIHLIEPNPAFEASLSALAQKHAMVQVHPVAVAGNGPTKRSLLRFNLERAASLHPPTGLKTLYPGLRQTGEAPVECITPKQMIEQLGIQGSNNLLILEAAGEELAILEALADSHQLQAFAELRIRIGQQPLYENASDAGAISAWLPRQGYDLVGSLEAESPEQRLISFTINAQWVQNQALKTENDRLKQELSEQQQQSQQASEQAQRERAQLKEQLGTVQKENDRLQAENTELKHRQTLFEQEMNKAEAQLEALQALLLEEEGSEP